MVEIRRTSEFSQWLADLSDIRARTRIARHLDKVSRNGLFGDIEPVGRGVSELRFHFGPGYRVYFKRRGDELIILLAGGDKGSQERDIRRAKQLADEYED